jgi:ferredoxin
MQGETIVLDKREKRKLAGEYPDLCLTCGTCAGGCPVTGVDGMDMRKAVRMPYSVWIRSSLIRVFPGSAPYVAAARKPVP